VNFGSWDESISSCSRRRCWLFGMSLRIAFRSRLAEILLYAFHFNFHSFFTFCSLCFSFHNRLHCLMKLFRSSFLRSRGWNSDKNGHQFAFPCCLLQISHHHMSSTQIFESNWEDFRCSFSNFEIGLNLFEIVKVCWQRFPSNLQFKILQKNRWD